MNFRCDIHTPRARQIIFRQVIPFRINRRAQRRLQMSLRLLAIVVQRATVSILNGLKTTLDLLDDPSHVGQSFVCCTVRLFWPLTFLRFILGFHRAMVTVSHHALSFFNRLPPVHVRLAMASDTIFLSCCTSLPVAVSSALKSAFSSPCLRTRSAESFSRLFASSSSS